MRTQSRREWNLNAGSVRLLTLLAGSLCLVAASATPDPLAGHYGNTVLCQEVDSRHACRLWLDPDGGYKVFYDFGPQNKPATVNGPFQFEGREGTYTIQRDANAVRVCLKPASTAQYRMQSDRKLFGEAACYAIEPRQPGANWTQRDALDRAVRLWLVAGR